jgi:glycosyltransferase involved in cell wall biosynthesis
MKLAFVYGPFSTGNRPFKFPDVWESPRGLTGSELSWFMYGFELSRLGHDVSFVVQKPNHVDVVGPSPRFEDYYLPVLDIAASEPADFDVVYAWNEPDLLRGVPARCVRACNQQLNDFGYCKLGFEANVDLFTGPSDWHVARCKTQTICSERWQMVPNGCDPDQYAAGCDAPGHESGCKAKGRVVYASSPDRGLHLLLQAWPAIRKATGAHLRIFYGDLPGWIKQFEGVEQHQERDFVELGCRARYVKKVLERADALGIEVMNAVSRTRMARELSEAEVLAYPCDTFIPTEGFSVTTMEGCASGALPITTEVDALGSIYSGWTPTVKSAKGDGLREWADLVIRALTDAEYAKRWRVRARELAEQHRWPGLAKRLEGILLAEVEKKRAA